MDNPTAADAITEWRRGTAAIEERIVTMEHRTEQVFATSDITVDAVYQIMGEIKNAVKDVATEVRDMVACIEPNALAAATVVAKQQNKAAGTTSKPWILQLPERYRDTPAKRKFLIDNPREFQALVALRDYLGKELGKRNYPHPEDHYAYVILLASTADQGAELYTNTKDATTTMAALSSWGYVLDLGVRNDGNRRLGKAWLFGRALRKGTKQPSPSWLEPPCVVPLLRTYRCEAWDDRHVQIAWANPDGPGLHRIVPAAWMYRTQLAKDRPSKSDPSAEALAIAETIRGH